MHDGQADLAEIIDLVVVGVLVIGREQDQPLQLQDAESLLDGGCRGHRLDAGGAFDQFARPSVAVGPLLHGVAGAMEHDDVALGVGERAGARA